MSECVWCSKKFAKDVEYFFYFKNKKAIIEPGFKFDPIICPECLFLRIQKYIDQRESFLEKFMEVKNDKVSINMKNFWKACKQPNTLTADSYSWDIEDFWWAIGILTEKNEGYRFNWGEESITAIHGRQGYYSFVSKEMAIEYAKHQFANTRNMRGICFITDYISPEEMQRI